jgi:hypothetical protein
MRTAKIAPREAVAVVSDVEENLNVLLGMINPKLHKKAVAVKADLLRQKGPSGHIARMWSSLFTCIAVISNGLTPPHRDSRGEIDIFDMLVSCGSAQDAKLTMPDLKACLRYDPGTVVFIYGRGLIHAVPAWKDGTDRCGWAHFLRGAQIRKLKLKMPGFMKLSDFINHYT